MIRYTTENNHINSDFSIMRKKFVECVEIIIILEYKLRYQGLLLYPFTQSHLRRLFYLIIIIYKIVCKKLSKAKIIYDGHLLQKKCHKL